MHTHPLRPALPASRYLRQAEALVAAVHGTLGFERDGARRLPGATADHPTRGGLRIGKADADGASTRAGGAGPFVGAYTLPGLDLSSTFLHARRGAWLR